MVEVCWGMLRLKYSHLASTSERVLGSSPVRHWKLSESLSCSGRVAPVLKQKSSRTLTARVMPLTISLDAYASETSDASRSSSNDSFATSLLPRNDSSDKKLMKEEFVWNSSFLQMVTLFLVMILWSADNMALPAVYAEIAQHFQLTPGDLGGLGLARGIFESICALPAGFLADRLPRPRLIALGCNIWALGLVGCAFSPNLRRWGTWDMLRSFKQWWENPKKMTDMSFQLFLCNLLRYRNKDGLPPLTHYR